MAEFVKEADNRNAEEPPYDLMSGKPDKEFCHFMRWIVKYHEEEPTYILKLFLNDQIAWQNVVINTLSWAAAIAFAYPANRKYVFESKNQNVFRECIEFVGSRITTGVMEVAMMSLTVNVMKLDFWISKLLVSVIVIVANYVLSKLVVFKIREK